MTMKSSDSHNPTRKMKSEPPDIDRALTNWVRNEEEKEMTVTDDDLKLYCIGVIALTDLTPQY